MVGFALTMAGLCVLFFYLGATLTWAWAKGSLDVPVPPWIPGVGIFAGALFAAASVLGGNWLTAASMAGLFLMTSGHQLWFWWRIERSGSGNPT